MLSIESDQADEQETGNDQAGQYPAKGRLFPDQEWG